MLAYSDWSESSDVSESSLAIPIIPFIGVRISWLMLATNSLLARLAPSANASAFCNFRRESINSVTSREIPNVPKMFPFSSCNKTFVVEHQVLLSSGYFSSSSLLTIDSPVSMICCSSFLVRVANSSVKKSLSVFPKTSIASRPNFLTRLLLTRVNWDS